MNFSPSCVLNVLDCRLVDGSALDRSKIELNIILQLRELLDWPLEIRCSFVAVDLAFNEALAAHVRLVSRAEHRALLDEAADDNNRF